MLCGHFSFPFLIFPRGDMIFFSDIPLSNCSTQFFFFFYKFIHNYIVFEAKFFVYTKGSHYADIFSSLFPIFFRRRNEFSFQTLLCLVLLIAHHSFSTNSFTIASFFKQNLTSKHHLHYAREVIIKPEYFNLKHMKIFI